MNDEFECFKYCASNRSRVLVEEEEEEEEETKNGRLLRIERAEFEWLNERKTAYCDYNGHPPLSKKLYDSFSSFSAATSANVMLRMLGNPHTAKAETAAVREARLKVLKHFGSEFGEYEIVFTSGATGAIKVVGDYFPFNERGAAMSYLSDNHTSVLGLRNLARSEGASCFVVDSERFVSEIVFQGKKNEKEKCLDDRNGALIKKKISWYARRSSSGNDAARVDGVSRTTTTTTQRKAPHLFAYNDESNFHGQGVCEHKMREKVREINKTFECFTLLDASKSASSNPVSLKDVPKEHRPDFIVASAYKIFGYPTGVGFLLVSNRAMRLLERRMNEKYFGGGTANAIDAETDFFVAKEGAAGLECGTLPFQQIAMLPKCFEWYNSIGGAEAIRKKSGYVGEVLASGLWNLRHANGKHIVEVYGSQWRHLAEHLMSKADYDNRYENLTYDGRKIISLSTVAFNVLNDDGSHVGYAKVERVLASENIIVRTGCCCNPGACESIQKNKIKDRVKKLYETQGKVCGDDMSVDDSDGEPLGCVRASFGYASEVEHAMRIIRAIEREFLVSSKENSAHAEDDRRNNLKYNATTTTKNVVKISEINVFPIKSCAPFSVKKWYILPSGLLFDRKYVLIEKQTGAPLTQKTYPQLVHICPSVEKVDLENGEEFAFTYLVLKNNADRRNKKNGEADDILRIDLNDNNTNDMDEEETSNILSVSVRGHRRDARLVRDAKVHAWFSRVLNTDCCLAVLEDKTKQTFSNTSPVLVVSEQSAQNLGCDVSRFRANIVVREDKLPTTMFELEKDWVVDGKEEKKSAKEGGECEKGLKIRGEISLGNGKFCHRCESIAIDQTTGMRDEKTWEIVMRKCSNKFGVSFDVLTGALTHIEVGDEIFTNNR